MLQSYCGCDQQTINGEVGEREHADREKQIFDCGSVAAGRCVRCDQPVEMSRYPNCARSSAHVEKDSESGSFPLPKRTDECIEDDDKSRDPWTKP